MSELLKVSMFIGAICVAFATELDDEEKEISKAYKKMPKASIIADFGESTGVVIESSGKAIESSGRAVESILTGAGNFISSIGTDTAAELAKKTIKKK